MRYMYHQCHLDPLNTHAAQASLSMAPYNNIKRWFDYLTSKDAIKLVGDKMETNSKQVHVAISTH